MAIRATFLAAACGFLVLLGPGCLMPGAGAASPQFVDTPRPVAPLLFRDIIGPSSGPSTRGFDTVPSATPAADLDQALGVQPPPGLEVRSGVDEHDGTPRPSAEAVAENPEIRFFLDRFTGSRRKVVETWVARSARYLGMMRDVFRRNDLPEELAFVAMVESGFNPLAVSRAGAKGLWQFMAGTARRYGLRVDQWVDERFDPEKSTVAAAAYFRDLYSMFGSWHLAHAAYNAGEMTIVRAIQSVQSNDFWVLARTRFLRPETRDFVPQIEAATLIGRDPSRYGFGTDPVQRAGADIVSVPPSTNLTTLAGGASIPVDVLRGLNPVLVKGFTPPDTRWDLRVPFGAREVVEAALKSPSKAMMAARRPVDRSARVSARAGVHRAEIHVVRPRDTLHSIAKRYGVSVGDVLRWNKLGQRDQIRPGDLLRVTDLRPTADVSGRGGAR